MDRLLDRIEYPRDMRQLDLDQLPQLAHEIREEVISVVSEVGGHFASAVLTSTPSLRRPIQMMNRDKEKRRGILRRDSA